MESINERVPVPLNRELAHLRSYPAIERLRFGERLNIIFNLHAKHFMIPSLTIQPIVENAVKHGVTKENVGGTIKISTFTTDSDFMITVEDDGKGFDVNELRVKDKKHLGIENVKNRLIKTICGGRLEITITPNEGTRFSITLPKKSNSRRYRESRF